MLAFFLSFVTHIVESKDLEDGTHKAKAGTAAFLIELEKKRSIKVSGYASGNLYSTVFTDLASLK